MPRITRRDFLNGVAVTIGASLLPSCSQQPAASQHEQIAEYYPPALTGLRGNHKGSFEVFHDLRDGKLSLNMAADQHEQYDLAIVGGGISGLSAAYFYRKHAGPNARILILDNHDDFGGHAKRNEFHVNGKTLLGFGGTFSIDSPAPYSEVAKGLIKELGIDVKRWSEVLDTGIYKNLGLRPAIFFDRETFGTDKTVRFPVGFNMWSGFSEMSEWNAKTWDLFLNELPIADSAKKDFKNLCTSKIDYLPHHSSAEKKSKLATISYADFLTKIVKVHIDVVKLLQARLQGLYGVGIDAVPAQDAWGLEMPGFQGMKLDPNFGTGMNRDSMEYEEGGDAYFFHFPDGNASIARLLVRNLIPGSIPGRTMDDVVSARCDYSKLDQQNSRCRIRLNSTVVRVNPSAKQVEISYVRNGKVEGVNASQCILACWSSVIPYLCPALPEKQKEDLAYEVKVPLLYTNVAIDNWKSFVNAGINSAYCPGSYHSWLNLDMPVSIGKYKCSQTQEDPIVIHMMRTPCSPGLSARQQHRAGRLELFNTKFETIEGNIRDQLNRILGPSGFDPARDIRAITVNRWAHGYAYQYNSLFDPFWLEGKETPCERARKPFGRIAIANADAAAYAYTDAAIDQAYRAVSELSAE
jgi:spermidine dehydrogenase